MRGDLSHEEQGELSALQNAVFTPEEEAQILADWTPQDQTAAKATLIATEK